MSEQPCSSAHVFLSFSSSTPHLSRSPLCSLSPLQCRVSHPYVLSRSLSMHQVVLLVISTAVQMKWKHQAFGDFNSNSRWVLQRSGELGFQRSWSQHTSAEAPISRTMALTKIAAIAILIVVGFDCGCLSQMFMGGRKG